MNSIKAKKPKKEYKFYNIVVDDEILADIHETKEFVSWQKKIRNFIKIEAKKIKACNGHVDVELETK